MPKFSIDAVIVIAIGFSAFKGLRKGLVAEVFKLAGMIGGFLVAAKYFDAGADILVGKYDLSKETASGISMVVLFVMTAIAFRVLAGMVRMLLKVTLLGWVDRIGGATFGGAKAALVLSGLLVGLSFLPGGIARSVDESSKLAAPLRGFAPFFYDTVFSLFPGSRSFSDKIVDTVKKSTEQRLGGSGGMPDELRQMLDDPQKMMEQLQSQQGKKSGKKREMTKEEKEILKKLHQ